MRAMGRRVRTPLVVASILIFVCEFKNPEPSPSRDFVTLSLSRSAGEDALDALDASGL